MLRTTSELIWCSTAPLSKWTSLVPVLWKLGVPKLYEPSLTPKLYGPCLQCTGACALDVLDSSQQLITNHPRTAPTYNAVRTAASGSIAVHTLPTGQAGREQCLRVEPMAVEVWTGQASSGGSICDEDLGETNHCGTGGARHGHSTRGKRSSSVPKNAAAHLS